MGKGDAELFVRPPRHNPGPSPEREIAFVHLVPFESRKMNCFARKLLSDVAQSLYLSCNSNPWSSLSSCPVLSRSE